MPYSQFICPDGKKCDIKECLKQCRLYGDFEAERCLPIPTLLAVAEQREWKDKPSTTQLINGTRETFLRITKDYAVLPEDMIWAIFGTGVHKVLEEHTPQERFICEERFHDDYSSGIPDLYDKESGFLYDYKTYGSYKTAKVMGLKKIRIPILDEQGKQRKYGNGRPMFDNQFIIGRKSRADLAYQLNDYRCKLEAHGNLVHKMVTQILTRDGGTYIAKDRGINKNACTVIVNKISDRWIKLYMKTKAERLKHALETGEMPPPCNHRETWGGLKCERFCQVWEYCDIGKKARGVT